MPSFVRDILTTLSYEPEARETSRAEGEELLRLDQRLADFTQGQGRRALSIRPSDCTVWNGNPRDVPALTYESCRSLIESIAQEDGNRIPVLVRRSVAGTEQPYELLVGSRRRFAVDWLNHNGRPEVRLNALVVEMSDEEAFRLADIENREREDITELDRARSYQAAVDRFYGGVQSRMAEALSLSNSQLSRLLSLAQMPDEVVNAFATKAELRVRHSEVLTPLLRRPEQRAQILAAAIAISEEQQRLAASRERMIAAATVLSRLRAATRVQGATPAEVSILSNGANVGKLRAGREGLTLDLQIAADADLEDLLSHVRHAVLSVRAQIASEPGDSQDEED